MTKVSDETLEVVLAHERAHVQRKDNWHALADRWVAQLWLPSLAKQLIRAITVQREQACDDAAAEEVESRTAVAEALLEVASINFRAVPSSMAFAKTALEQRVERLCQPIHRLRRTRVPVAFAVSLLSFSAWREVHHALEAILAAALH